MIDTIKNELEMALSCAIGFIGGYYILGPISIVILDAMS